MSVTINSVDEGFRWFESFTNLQKNTAGFTRKYRLDRMAQLATIFGDPQKSYQIIHIAGSKGKGSTAAYIAAGLHARGDRTGLFISPHISDYRERISLAEEIIPEEAYLSNMRLIYRKLNTLPSGTFPASDEPTTFELLTMLAFLVYKPWSVNGLSLKQDSEGDWMPQISFVLWSRFLPLSNWNIPNTWETL